jgi:hypothetical protein
MGYPDSSQEQAKDPLCGTKRFLMMIFILPFNSYFLWQINRPDVVDGKKEQMKMIREASLKHDLDCYGEIFNDVEQCESCEAPDTMLVHTPKGLKCWDCFGHTPLTDLQRHANAKPLGGQCADNI